MSRETKFGYGFLFVGAGLPYLIDKAFGLLPAIIASSLCLVGGIVLLIAGHRHRDQATSWRRGVMGTIGLFTLVGASIGAAVGGLSGAVWTLARKHQTQPESKAAESGHAEPPVKPNIPPAAEDKTRPIPAPPITKVDKFAVVMPFDAAHKNVPIPMNENFSDPKRRFYQDLLSLSGRPDKPPEGQQYADRDFSTEEARAQFIGRLLQYYVFRSVDELQRDSEGIEWTADRGSRPIVRVGIVPPDSAPYPRETLFATLSKSEFFRPFDRMTWNENRPVMMPKHTVIHLVEQPGSPTTGVAAYIVRFERPKYFSLEFKITQTVGPVSVTGVPGASLPTGFQTKINGVVGYPFIVTMRYGIERPHDEEFRSEDYAKWGDALFSGLRLRLAFDSSGE